SRKEKRWRNGNAPGLLPLSYPLTSSAPRNISTCALRRKKTRQSVRSQKIQLPGNLVRQSAGEIRAGIDGALGATRCPQRVGIVLRLSVKFLTSSSDKPINLWYQLLTRRFLTSLRFRGAAADDFFVA